MDDDDFFNVMPGWQLEQAELIGRRHHLQKIASQSSNSWQLRLSAFQAIVDLSPRLWELMRNEPPVPEVENAISKLADSYAVLLDSARLSALQVTVSTVKELKATHSDEIAAAQADLPRVQALYDQIKANPCILQTSLDARDLIYAAAAFGIIKREKRGRSYALTFVGIPTFVPESIPESNSRPIGKTLSIVVSPAHDGNLSLSKSDRSNSPSFLKRILGWFS